MATFVSVDVTEVAERILGVKIASSCGSVDVSKDVRLHRFNDDALHILVDGGGSYKAIAQPGTENEEVLREGHLSEFIHGQPQGEETHCSQCHCDVDCFCDDPLHAST